VSQFYHATAHSSAIADGRKDFEAPADKTQALRRTADLQATLEAVTEGSYSGGRVPIPKKHVLGPPPPRSATHSTLKSSTSPKDNSAAGSSAPLSTGKSAGKLSDSSLSAVASGKVRSDAPCDRGVECFMYDSLTEDALGTGAGLISDVDHLFPPPPYVGPLDFDAKAFKGLFRCDVGTGCPTYSAAFLATRSQLLSRAVGPAQTNNKQTNMESASYHLFGGKGESAVWTSVDAFDFSVEHISMYERVLQSTSLPPSPLRNALLAAYGQRLSLIERDYRLKCSEGSHAAKWHAARKGSSAQVLGARTVAVMPFYAVGAGSGHSIRDTKLKYLNITVHSILCHFDAVVAAVSHPLDKEYVLHESGLPIYDVIEHNDLPRPSSAGMFTLMRIQDRLRNDPRWKHFEYVFYTEADQILHLRTTQVFAPLLASNAKDRAQHRSPMKPQPLRSILIPHRFHSVPSVQDFAHVDSKFNDSTVYTALVTSASPERTMTNLLKASSTPSGQHQTVASTSLPAAVDPNFYQWFYPGEQRTTIRRELDLYEARPTTRFPAVQASDSCCFLRTADDARGPGAPYRPGNNSQAWLAAAEGVGGLGGHGSFATPLYYPEREAAKRPKITDPSTAMFAVGNGFGMVAGDCCFICTFKNRYCHNTCQPRVGVSGRHSDGGNGEGDACGRGSFAGDYQPAFI